MADNNNTPFAYHTGRIIGRYTLQTLIGSGGTAEVYKSVHPELQRPVAIKVLYPNHTQESDFVRRFRQEAQTAAALTHPHIVHIYDFDKSSDGLYYIVMQLIDGPSLETFLAEHNAPLAMETAYAFFTQIADALQFAHKKGTIHRDLKPANVLLDENQHLYLSDFGFAKLVGGTVHTRSGVTLGTPIYMAPEQIENEPVTPMTDVYALGAILYRLLTNQLPYDDDNVLALILHKLEGLPPSPKQFNPQVTPAVEKLIFKAMALDPEARFATVAAMKNALKAALQEKPAPPVIPPVIGKTVPQPAAWLRPVKRKPLPLVLLSLLLIILFFFLLRHELTAGVTPTMLRNNLSKPLPVGPVEEMTQTTAVPATTTRPPATAHPLLPSPTKASATPTANATAGTTPSATMSPTATPSATATATNSPTATPQPTATFTTIPPTATPLPASPPPPTNPPPSPTSPPPPTAPPDTPVPPTRTPPPQPTRTPPSP